jgi:hypothetical protein
LLAESALRWNWSAQIGAIAATTALLAVLSANVFAVLPSIHPPQPKPMASVATAPRCWHKTFLPDLEHYLTGDRYG